MKSSHNLCVNSDFCGSTGEFVPCMHEIAEAGFTHYFWCHQWNTDFLYTAPELEEIRSVQKRTGLRLLDIHGSAGHEKCWDSPVEYMRRAGVELVKNRIEMLDALEGEGVLVMHAPRLQWLLEGTPLAVLEKANNEARRGFEAVCRSLDELMPVLEKYDRKIAIENLSLDDWSMIDAYIARYSDKRIGICYDCGHANLRKDQMYQMDKRKAHLIATHLHDNDGIGDLHRPVFTTSINFERLAKIIAESSYTRPLSFEIVIRNTPFMDPEKDIYSQTAEARKAFLADAFEKCVRFADMVEAYRAK